MTSEASGQDPRLMAKALSLWSRPFAGAYEGLAFRERLTY